jgi:flagellar hook protein FlgE
LGSAAQPAAVSGYGPGGAAVSSANEQAGPGKVDMATEQVTQLSSLRAFQANVAVLRTADDMLGSLISQRG